MIYSPDAGFVGALKTVFKTVLKQLPGAGKWIVERRLPFAQKNNKTLRFFYDYPVIIFSTFGIIKGLKFFEVINSLV